MLLLVTATACRPTRTRAHGPCATFGNSDVEALKAEIVDVVASGAAEPEAVRSRIALLESMDIHDRPAGSPLLDGRWKTVWSDGAPRWARLGPLTHAIEGGWLGDKPSRYSQCSNRLGVGLALHASYTSLGGDDWELDFDLFELTVLGLPLWRRRVRRREADLDHGIRPTFLDGEMCVLRAPAVQADTIELRPERIYVMSRIRNVLNNDMEVMGSSNGFVQTPKWLDVD